MTGKVLAAGLVVIVAVGCTDQSLPTGSSDEASVVPGALIDGPAFGRGPLVHHVSVGGPDADIFGGPGGDANFSLVANEHADGSVSGQWEDSFGHGNGVHIEVDCLNVLGNGAVIGGAITYPKAFAGVRSLTAVVDNGTSANDPVDQISPSFFFTIDECTDLALDDFPQLDFTQGQVKVQ